MGGRPGRYSITLGDGKAGGNTPEPDDPHSARNDDTQLSAAPIGKLPALQPRRAFP
jgi:hypothetical protein